MGNIRVGQIRIGDKYKYRGRMSGYHEYFHITQLDPIMVMFVDRDCPDGPYSPEDFKTRLLINYQLSETTKVSQILNEYER